MTSPVLVEPPDHTRLVDYAVVKAELKIPDDDDTIAQEMLDDAEAVIEQTLGRPILRARYSQRVALASKVVLSVRPIASIEAVDYYGAAQSVTDWTITSRGAGTLQRSTGSAFFYESCPPGRDELAFGFETVAGWFTFEDVLTDDVSVDSADNSYNSAGIFPTFLRPGDPIVWDGFTNGENNGRVVVKTATKSKITVANTLVTEAATPASLTLDPSIIVPSAFRRAAMILVRDAYLSRTYASGGSLVEETIQGVSTLRYSAPLTGETARIARDSVSALLHPYMDV